MLGSPSPCLNRSRLGADRKIPQYDRALEPVESPNENSPGVDRGKEPRESPSNSLGDLLGENSPGVVRALEPIEKSPGAKTEQKMSQSAIASEAENSLGVEVEQAQEAIGNSRGVDCPHPAIEFASLESALAPASARLRAPNQKLLELARSQSEVIGKAKDISPVEKPSLCRVLKLARTACLDVSFRCHRSMDSQHGNHEAGF